MRTKPCLSLTDVKKILEACEVEALKNRWNVAVANVDEGAHLLGFQRLDGAGPISAEVASGKARTSGLTKRPSKFFEDRANVDHMSLCISCCGYASLHCRQARQGAVGGSSNRRSGRTGCQLDMRRRQ